MKTETVKVVQYIDVTINEALFTEEFMEEFRESFYPFETLDEHYKHLAMLYARGFYNEGFVEGYGDPEEMGIKIRLVDVESEVE